MRDIKQLRLGEIEQILMKCEDTVKDVDFEKAKALKYQLYAVANMQKEFRDKLLIKGEFDNNEYTYEYLSPMQVINGYVYLRMLLKRLNLESNLNEEQQQMKKVIEYIVNETEIFLSKIDETLVPLLKAFSEYLLYYLEKKSKMEGINDFIAGYLLKTHYITEATKHYFSIINGDEKKEKLKEIKRYAKEEEKDLGLFDRGFMFFSEIIHNKNGNAKIILNKCKVFENEWNKYVQVQKEWDGKIDKNSSKSPEAILRELKNTGVEENFDRNAGKTKFLDI